jgi:glycerol-3-phosphate acyltransferase PlsX
MFYTISGVVFHDPRSCAGGQPRFRGIDYSRVEWHSFMITIAIDAMGGDSAPVAEVSGALLAIWEYGVKILLVGAEEPIQQELRKHPRPPVLPEIIPAREAITMHDAISQAVRKKKESSLHVAARLVRDGKADGLVSAGNTGACMAISKLILGALPQVDRPAIAAVMPTARNRPVVLVDVGANVDCKPNHLVQFALMGEIFSRTVLGNSSPLVGLLSIGEEETKGNELTREVLAQLKRAPFHFAGNVEGRDIFRGEVDVVVCDGFTGNVALKLSEGLTEMVVKTLREDLSNSWRTRLGAWLARPAFRNFKRRIDYSEYGGAPLLGIKGVSIVCHGSSPANAIKNAIRVARDYCSHRVNEKIEAEIQEVQKTLLPTSG